MLDNVLLGFFFRCDACCFDDLKKKKEEAIRLQFCVTKQVLRLLESASSGVKMSLKGFQGFSCHSF